jgi:cephalosporin-C deacetylase-like acetyl esterase
MSHIPSIREIRQNFQHDVTLKSWRKKPMDGTGPVVFTGAQKDLFDHLMELAADYERERKQTIARIKTKADVLKRGAMAQRIFRAVQGLTQLPPRTPLKARESFAFVRDGYEVHRLILESRPQFFVTANVYRPTRHEPPFPAVLYTVGHYDTGKAGTQQVPARLAQLGFLVLVTDPAGQGERDEYADIATGRRTVRRSCRSHGTAGDLAYLLGANFGAYRLWDCARCVDYLQSRRDVIGARIGVTGISGGGWESLWLGAIDPRIKAINTNCYLTTWRRRMESRGRDAEPDPEQDPFGVLAAGVDAADLLTACIPRAVSLGATTGDLFPLDGTLDCYEEAKKLFKIAGMEEKLALTISGPGHVMTAAMREQTYRWMLRWLKDVPAPAISEPDDFTPEAEPLVNCTETGIVLTSLGGRTTAELNAERARELALERRRSAAKLTLSAQSTFVRRHLAKLLRFEPSTTTPWVENGNAKSVGELRVTPMRISGEGRLWLTAHLWDKPGRDARAAIVCVFEKDAGYDPFVNATCQKFAESGAVVLDLDPIGMGPLRELWLDFVPLIEADLTYDAFLLGHPLLGLRVRDVMRGVDVLRSMKGADANDITVYGREYGALLVLFAGCLDKRITRVIEYRPLTSYSSLAWHRDYAWPVNMFLPDALRHFDLEDVRAAVAPRSLKVISPFDHLKKRLTAEQMQVEFSAVRRAYREAKTSECFSICNGG